VKILLSAYACRPHRGSEPGFGWNWATALAEAGHEVHVLTRADGQASIEPELQQTPRPRLYIHYAFLPRSAKTFLRGQMGVYLTYLLWQRAALRHARALDAEHNFDLVHHVTWGAISGGSALWRLGKPFLFGPLGGGQTPPVSLRSYFGSDWVSEALRSWFVRHVVPHLPGLCNPVRHARLVLCTNPATEELAKRMGAAQTALMLDSGLPSDFSAPPSYPPQTGPLRVLWVGRLYPRKALRLSFDAIARMQRPVHLTVLGDGPLGDRVPQWIDDLGIADRVTWHGHVPWDQVRTAYRTHDVFLFNSLRDSFGSQLLEAMAHGLPIVTLDLHGARAFVPDAAGIKVAATTPDATAGDLAKALDTLTRHRDRWQEMQEAGRDLARQMTWARKAERITAIYETLVVPAHSPERPSLQRADSLPFSF